MGQIDVFARNAEIEKLRRDGWTIDFVSYEPKKGPKRWFAKCYDGKDQTIYLALTDTDMNTH